MLTTQIGRDALGRITHYIELGAGSFERASIVYDRANRELSETSFTGRGDGVYKTVLTNTYTGGQLTRQQQRNFKYDVDADAPDTDQSYSYAWWDGAIQSGISYDSDTGSASNALWTTAYTLDGSGHVTSARIVDGQPRTVTFVTDQSGMVVSRAEAHDAGGNEPRSLHYLFGGQQMGTASNNGTDNTSYTVAIRDRVATPPASPGPFANGAATGTAAYDFDRNYDAINGSSVGSTGGSYTCQGGETLASIAQQLWGDASLWYLLADANGMTGSTELTAGQTVAIPNKVINRHNTADTFRPYDPNEALGDNSPTDAASRTSNAGVRRGRPMKTSAPVATPRK